MDEALRNSLWNVLDMYLWTSNDYLYTDGYRKPLIMHLSQSLWFKFYKEPLDTRPDSGINILREIRKRYFHYEWYEAYDFIEFVATFYIKDKKIEMYLNKVLEREMSAFRIISGTITDIIDQQEIEMIQKALTDDQYSAVTAHLKRAFELYSDRENPDYRNSIKESISAVESLAKIITGSEKATLSDVLKVLEKDKKIHGALQKGFSSLYGYTSDEDGVRHAMLNEPNLSAADAKYFMLSCTSFVNYLKSQI